jgi:hypothetical protein
MSDDTQPDPAQRYEEMDEKLVLVQILAELQAIRTEVTDTGTGAAPTPDTDRTDAAEMYRCDKCRNEVKAGDRYDHALDAHKAPPKQAERMFTPV